MLISIMRSGLVVTFAVTTMAGDASYGWSICDIGALGPTADFTVPTDMNNQGVVIGDSHILTPEGTILGYVWSHGVMRAVPEPEGASYVHVRAINDAGQIAGDAIDYEANATPYRWTGDAYEVIGVLRTGREALAWGINNLGHVTGYSAVDPVSPRAHAFVWDGTLHELLPVTGNDAHNCEGYDIHDDGIIVGSSTIIINNRTSGSAARWREGVGESLGMLPGDTTSTALRINNSGSVIGVSWYEWEAHAVLWRDGEIIALTPNDPDDPESFETSEAYDINDFDEIVGAGITEAFEGHGFLWLDGAIILMDDLMPIGFPWKLGAEAINNAGQMACRAFWRADPSGVPQRTFILTPPVCRGFPTGDANCDGLVNNFDIDAFVLALSNVDQYAATYAACNWLCNLDINRDGAVNNFDIDPFVMLLAE